MEFTFSILLRHTERHHKTRLLRMYICWRWYMIATYQILHLLYLKIYFLSSLNTSSVFFMPAWSTASCIKFPVDRKIGRIQQETWSLQQIRAHHESCFYSLSFSDSSGPRGREIDFVKCSMNMMDCILCNVMKIIILQLPDYNSNHSSESEKIWDSCKIFHSRCLESSWPKPDSAHPYNFPSVCAFSLFALAPCDLCHRRCFSLWLQSQPVSYLHIHTITKPKTLWCLNAIVVNNIVVEHK